MTTLNTMTKMETKVINSFIAEFGYQPTTLYFIEEYAFVDNYCCRLNSIGVKKNSWRLNIYN
jgi:hypothetical protein